MSHNHPSHQRLKQIVNIPGISRGFQHDLVAGEEVFGELALKPTEGNTPGRQHHLLGSVDRSHHHIAFVDIKGHIPLGLLRHNCLLSTLDVAAPQRPGETCLLG
jgi:hypothetical protein